MKKIIVLVLGMLLAGCQQLLQGQQQPVLPLKNDMYLTACGGAVETWGSCNDRAMLTCKDGYLVVKKTEDSTGTKRELTFQCNK